MSVFGLPLTGTDGHALCSVCCLPGLMTPSERLGALQRPEASERLGALQRPQG